MILLHTVFGVEVTSSPYFDFRKIQYALTIFGRNHLSKTTANLVCCLVGFSDLIERSHGDSYQ